MGKATEEKICFLCCKRGADTVEHFVPRTLYPGPLPSEASRWTAPSHKGCNAATTKEEERFRNHIGAIALEMGERALYEATARAFARPEGQNMKRRFAELISILPDGSGEFSVDRACVAYTLAKIAKGILFNSAASQPVIPPAKVRWGIRQFVDLSAFPVVYEILKCEIVPGVLVAHWCVDRPDPLRTYWFFSMYGSVKGYAMQSIPMTRPLSIRYEGDMFLTWPKPRA